MLKTLSPCLAGVITVALTGLATLSAAAAVAAAEDEPVSRTSRYLEEVVVTAEKREESLQEAAVVGTVFNDDTLRRNFISEIDDLEFSTPSLTVATAGQSNQMNLRGIGKFDSGGTSTSAVATYRDGVGTVSGFFNQEPYYDIASVEVLRGPQGTFVGENAAAGAIFVNTVDPTIDGGVAGFVEGGYGSYNATELTGAINVPMGDRFAMRIAGRHSDRDSFFHVFLDPDATQPHPGHPGDLNYNSIRIGALWQPTDPLLLKMKIDYNKLDHGGHVYGNVPGFPTPIGSITGEPYGNISDDLYTVGNNFLGVLAKDEMVRGIFELDYDFAGGSTIRWVSGAQYIDTRIRNDDDGSVDEDIRQHIRPIFRVYTTEATFIAPAERRLHWLAGVFYRRENLQFPWDDGFVIYQPPDTSAEFLRILWDTPRTTAAAYGQVGYDLTDTLELEVGARYQYYKTKQDADIRLFKAPFLRRIDSYDENTFNYKVALNWRPGDEHYFYLFVATGNTTGGSSVIPNIPSFSNQTSTAFEAGWKGTLLDGQLYTQFGGFYTLIDDYQASFAAVIDETTDPPLFSSTFQNLDGDTKTWGIELQAQSQLGAFGVDFNAAWIHSELGDDLIYDETLGRLIETGGNVIPWTPKYTFNVGAQYDFQVGRGYLLTPRVTYSWIDTQTVTATDRIVDGVPIDRIFSHELVNLQLVLSGGPWRFEAYMRNAGKEQYIQAHSGAPGHPDAYANAPRQYGFRVKYDFGS
jgi:iron complex outermembrane receptor protein